MFRTIHSSQISFQWAKIVLQRYKILNKVLDAKRLEFMLHECRHELYRKYNEPPYEAVIGMLYDKLSETLDIGVGRNDFVKYSLQADTAIELGCQYPNKHFIKRLRKAKKYGAKIYIVSDFYLPRKCYESFLLKAKCDDIFDGVYVSEDCNLTKRGGGLYDYVINDLGIAASDTVMFGDSRRSDVKMPSSRGIKGHWYFPFRHKVLTNISRMLKVDFGNSVIKKEAQRLYRNTVFEEYSIIIFYFIRQLLCRSKELGADRLAFLSRGGYFLLEAYNVVQNLYGYNGVVGLYCFNSRRACFNAESDKDKVGEQYVLMREYLESFRSKNKCLYIVDEGWYNHSQQSMCKTLSWGIYGFYIGSCYKDVLAFDNVCHREGLLFDYKSENEKSKYYGIFCTNRAMYEQILTASHGSVVGYMKSNEGAVEPILKSNEKETYIYRKYIHDMQKHMLLEIQGLSAWTVDKEISIKCLAKMMLKTSIFNSRKRCAFLNELDANRYDNCSNGEMKDKTVRDVHIDIKKLIMHPDEYVGMFAKLQRKIYKSTILSLAYYPIAIAFYFYTYFMTFLKR